MARLRKILATIIIITITGSLLARSDFIMVKIKASAIANNPVKVAVIVYNSDDLYIAEIIKNIKDIQKENKEKVEFSFFLPIMM